MLIDARTLPNERTLRADVCVVGAGAAGLTIAHALARSAVKVVVLEGGDAAAAPQAQELCEGVISGDPYYPLDTCRFRTLGGSTSAWGGWCRPLEAGDFESLDRAVDTGWPFRKAELEAFYLQAERVCRLLPHDDRDRGWDVDGPPPLVRRDQSLFDAVKFRIQPVRFGDVYRPLFRQSNTADLLLNANALDLGFDVASRTVERVRAATLAGNRMTVQADKVVLAAGGLENPRLLLTSSGANGRAVGNEHGLVGRYFTDHLHVALGVVRAADGGDYYQCRRSDGTTTRTGLAPKPTVRGRGRAAGFAITLHNARDPHDIVALGQRSAAYGSLQTLAAALERREWPEDGFHLLRTAFGDIPQLCHHVYRRFVKPRPTSLLIGCRAEQVPDPDSRVTLVSRRDRLGMPQIHLQWRIGSVDRETIAAAQAMIADALVGSRLQLFSFEPDNRRETAQPIWAGAHHIGTTRMNRDPRMGVVDEHGRVHGTRNLYVTGSSVFPRGGWAPPTLTIVALALRLADRLASDTSRGYTTA